MIFKLANYPKDKTGHFLNGQIMLRQTILKTKLGHLLILNMTVWVIYAIFEFMLQ